MGAISTRVIAANRAAERDLNLIARVEVQEDELLELYEPAPGTLMFSGAGAPRNHVMVAERAFDQAVTNGDFEPDAYWEAMTRSSAPPELRAAFERHRERTGNLRRPDAIAPANIELPQVDALAQDALVDKHLSSAWCDDEYYDERGASSGYGDRVFGVP